MNAYEHREYDPIVNARAHQLGKRRRIMNRTVDRQYRRLLEVLCYKRQQDITKDDLLAVTYFQLLQVWMCGRVNPLVPVR